MSQAVPALNVEAPLSAEYLARFESDGFLVVPGLFGAEAMSELDRWTDEIAARPEEPGRHMVYYEDSIAVPGERVLSRIENFCAFHDGFDRALNAGPILSAVSALFGEPAVLFKDKINFKMPGSDGFKSHQDVQAGWDRYAALHITMLISIDAATPDNGCLEIAPGLHRQGLLGDMWAPIDDDARNIAYRPVPTARGDAVFFDSFVPHRSAPNGTDRARRVLYVTYNRASEGDSRARYYADKRESYPPDVERLPGREYRYKV